MRVGSINTSVLVITMDLRIIIVDEDDGDDDDECDDS